MIEMAMFFGLGFFTACLATIFVANAVWRRAVRLTTKRVQSAMPISLAEIKADRDQLRADFAMSTRKLELSVDELKQKMQGQVTEIAKKNEQVRLLLLEAKSKSDSLRDLEQHEQNQRFELLKSESELSEISRKYREAEKKLADAQHYLAERDKALASTQSVADERRVELSSLSTKIAQMQNDVEHLQQVRQGMETEHNTKHEALIKTERELSNQRAAGKSMAMKLEALDSTVQAQAKIIGQLEAKTSELTAQLRSQMAENERIAAKANTLLSNRDKIDEEQARVTADAQLRLNTLLQDVEYLRSERASVDGQLAAARQERDRLASNMKQLESGAHENWEKERSDNAILRERINDIASEITALGGAVVGDEEGIRRTLGANAPQALNPPPAPNPYRTSATAAARKDALPSGMVPSQQTTRKNDMPPRKTSLAELRAGVTTTVAEPPRKLTLAERMRRLQERSGA